MRIVELFDKDSVLGNIEDKVTGAVKSVVGDKPTTTVKEPVASTKSVPKELDNNVAFQQEFEKQGIKDPYLQKAILGKFGQESGAKYGVEEIPYTNTSNSRIREKLPQFARMSDSELNALKADPKAFFNKAYGGQLSNTGDDGYNFRGRGLTGLTGRSNYAAADKALGLGGALVKNPELLAQDPELDKKVAVWYYKNAGGDKQSFASQDEANQWAIYKAGGKAYAPGTALGVTALADMNSRTSGSSTSGSQLVRTANSVIDKIKNTASAAGDYAKTAINTAVKPEDEVELIINGKKVKFKNKKEALLAFAQAKAQGQDVQGV